MTGTHKSGIVLDRFPMAVAYTCSNQLYRINQMYTKLNCIFFIEMIPLPL